MQHDTKQQIKQELYREEETDFDVLEGLT